MELCKIMELIFWVLLLCGWFGLVHWSLLRVDALANWICDKLEVRLHGKIIDRT